MTERDGSETLSLPLLLLCCLTVFHREVTIGKGHTKPDRVPDLFECVGYNPHRQQVMQCTLNQFQGIPEIQQCAKEKSR